MPARSRLSLVVLPLLLPLAAHALCSSDDAPQPAAVLERFINADCAECWRDPATPRADANTLALDWIVPGRKGPDAPLAAVASDDAMERLYFLGEQVPDRASALATPSKGDAVQLRLAQGDAFNDYLGVSIELRKPGREQWRAWLLLVEKLPAGIEGSPVPRNVVRNVFRPEWYKVMARSPGDLAETRAMQIHDGARAQRLRLVAVLHDARGRIRAIRQTACSE